jgi:hypothetical protein
MARFIWYHGPERLVRYDPAIDTASAEIGTTTSTSTKRGWRTIPSATRSFAGLSDTLWIYDIAKGTFTLSSATGGHPR